MPNELQETNIYRIGMIEEYKSRLLIAYDTIVNIQRIVAGVTDAERSK